MIQLRRVVEKFEGQYKQCSNNASLLNSKTFIPKQVKLGTFTLSSGLVEQMSHSQWRLRQLPIQKELFEQIPNNLSVQLGGKLHLHNGSYYVGQNPTHPQFGDLRIRFFVIRTETVSVVAKPVGSRLVPYRTQSGHDIELLKSGVVSMEEVISTHSEKIIPAKYYFTQFSKRVPLYLLGFLTLSFGIYLLFLMLKLLNNFPPAWAIKDGTKLFFTLLFILLISSGLPVLFFLITANNATRIIMIERFIITLIIILGIYVLVLLLSKLLKYIPFFDKLIKRLNWLSALIITVSLFLIIIASIWIRYLPILGVTLIVIAVFLLYFLKPAHRLLTPINFELPEPTLKKETVVPQKEY